MPCIKGKKKKRQIVIKMKFGQSFEQTNKSNSIWANTSPSTCFINLENKIEKKIHKHKYI